MGEDKKSIHIVGSPDVDIILNKNLPNLNITKSRYNIKFDNFCNLTFSSGND